jgi:hypothetical protein
MRIKHTLLARGYAKTVVDDLIKVAEAGWSSCPETFL